MDLRRCIYKINSGVYSERGVAMERYSDSLRSLVARNQHCGRRYLHTPLPGKCNMNYECDCAAGTEWQNVKVFRQMIKRYDSDRARYDGASPVFLRVLADFAVALINLSPSNSRERICKDRPLAGFPRSYSWRNSSRMHAGQTHIRTHLQRFSRSRKWIPILIKQRAIWLVIAQAIVS